MVQYTRPSFIMDGRASSVFNKGWTSKLYMSYGRVNFVSSPHLFLTDGPYGRIKTWAYWLHHQLPPRPWVVQVIYSSGRTRLFQRLKMPRVLIWLVVHFVDSFFRDENHVSSSGWLCRFMCLGQPPINSGMPSLPSSLLRFFSFDLHRLESHLRVSLRP